MTVMSVQSRPRHQSRLYGRLIALDALLILVVLFLAVLYRVPLQGQIPPGMDFDEAFESLEARKVLTTPYYHPVFFAGNNGVPPLKIYLTALAFLVGGESDLAIRHVSVIVGILTVVAVYGLTRSLFPLPRSGLDDDTDASGLRPIARVFLPFVASAILAVLPWHVTFSRHGIEVVLLPLWATMAVFLLWKGLTTSKWPWFVLSGFFWGSSFYTYQAAWFLPGVLVVFVVYKIIQERGFLRRYGRQLALLALAAVIVALPLAFYAYRNPVVFATRGSEVSLFAGEEGGESPWLSLARNTLKVAGLFVLGGDISIADNIPLRPPMPLPLALALYLGLAVALFRIKRPAYALLLIWFAWMLLPTVVTSFAPSIRRGVGAAPAMVILTAIGLATVFQWIAGKKAASQPNRVRTGIAAAVITAVLLQVAAWGYQYYFVDYPQGKQLFQDLDVGLMAVGKYAANAPKDARFYYSPAGEYDVFHLPVAWQLRDRDLRKFDGKYGLVLAPSGQQPGIYVITSNRGDTFSLPALQQAYPGGSVAYSVNNPFGDLHSVVFTVPPNTAPSLPIQNGVSATFEDGIELVGSALSAPEVRPGDAMTVTLFWRSTGGPTAESHTVFTHLVGPPKESDGSTLWAGHDAPPLNNSYPTTRWDTGEIVVDRHTFVVPADAPPGKYEVEVGFYTPQQNGARLKVIDDDGQPDGSTATDSVKAGVVTVR